MNFSQLGFGFFVLKINGIFLALIFSVAVWLFYKKLESEKLDTDYLIHNLWKWVVAGVLVGRILTLLMNPQILSEDGIYAILTFWRGGISFYGALLAGLGTMFFDLKKLGKDAWKWFDLAVPYLLIFACLTDFAGFLTGAVYGGPTDLFWGVQYETFGVDIIDKVHPVTIYALIIHSFMLYWANKYGKTFYRQRGKLFLMTVILFFFAEFFLQFFRGDPTLQIFGNLRIEQVFDLLLVAGSTIYLQKRVV